VYLLKPLPRRNPAWYHFNYTKLGTELEKLATDSMSGVQLLPDFKDSVVGDDGFWLTTDSWQRLMLHIFESVEMEPQVIISDKLLFYSMYYNICPTKNKKFLRNT
jgi:hypothetical protein